MASTIIGIDHLHISVLDLDAEISNYRALLNTDPVWAGLVDGKDSAVFEAGNICLWLSASESAEGLSGICFRVDSLERHRRRMYNLTMDLEVDALEDPLVFLAGLGGSGRLDRLATACARGLAVSFVARDDTRALLRPSRIFGLDHLVISSSSPEATAFFLAARMGLELRMDLSREDWGARFMFYRCGDLIIETYQPLQDNQTRDSDSLLGLSWRTNNADKSRADLAERSFDVSDVEEGRKVGTKVFTVRDRTAGVPTIVLQANTG
jgi:hypothetical protein